MRADDRKLLRAVGRRVAELRAQNGKTQEELAVDYGASVKALQNIELGRQNLTLLTMARLARALGVEVRTLLDQPATLRANAGRPPGRRTGSRRTPRARGGDGRNG
jgi:transcriptional regulator with XRE-family HTH domain